MNVDYDMEEYEVGDAPNFSTEEWVNAKN